MRLGRLGFTPDLSKPVHTLGWRPRPNLAPSEKAIPAPAVQTVATQKPAPKPAPKPRSATGKVRKPTNPGDISNTQCSIRADWPAVINALLQCQDVRHTATLAEMVGVCRPTLSLLRNGRNLPGEQTGKQLAALWEQKIGGKLP